MSKSIITFAFIFCVTGQVTAQFNYYKFSTELKAGWTKYSGDIGSVIRLEPFVAGGLAFHINPYLKAVIELENGVLSGGDSIRDPHHRFFKNRYQAGGLHFRAYLGWLIQNRRSGVYRLLRGIYGSAGFGMIRNSMSEIRRTTYTAQNKPYIFPGESKSSEQIFPLSIGNALWLKDQWGYDRWAISINYRLTLSSGEGIDGYSDPPVIFRNNSYDMYQTVCLGVSYYFRPEGLYRK